MKYALLLGMFAVTAGAQSVQVYSEFVQFNSAGEPVAPENPREILSPAIARNAFSSFQLAIQVPKAAKFQLFMGQNPDGALNVTVYRRAGGKLEPVVLPFFSDSTQIFWVDVWVDANAPVRRVKLEPQVYVDGDWVTYPMELRVSEAVVPSPTAPEAGLADPFEVMQVSLCGGKFRPLASRVPIGADLQFRNAQQDVRLAAKSPAALREELKKVMGGCSASHPADLEFYLRLRDLFFNSPKKVQ